MRYEPPRDPHTQNPEHTASDNTQQSESDNSISSDQNNTLPGNGNANRPTSGTNRTLSLRDLRTFTSLKNPVFRLYYIAMLGQMGAMNMQMIVRSLLIYRITESGTALGIMALANAAPMLFFSLFGGVIADRVQKKYVLFWGQLVSALISLVMALSIVFGFLGEDKPDSW